MNSDTVRKIIANLRDPLDSSRRIHFTARAIRFLTSLFENTHIDVIDLHSLFLNLAYRCGCFADTGDLDRKYVNLKDIVTYLMIHHPACISLPDIVRVGDTFTIDKDNEFHEVSDMLLILSSLR